MSGATSFWILLVVGFAINGAAALLSLWQGAVDPGGAATGTAIGTAIFAAGGPLFWLILMVFFVSSSGFSRLGRRRKAALGTVVEKGDRRDFAQVLANGGIGALSVCLYRITGNPAWAVGFAVSFAASNADTWASEIGVLSRREPRHLLTLRRVSRGISGGVSALGFTAALGGAAVVAVVFALVSLGRPLSHSSHGLGATAGLVGMVTGFGFLGSLVDSLLGATIQAQYRHQGRLTERPSTEGMPNQLVRGLRFVTNDVVNLASCVVATAAAVTLWS